MYLCLLWCAYKQAMFAACYVGLPYPNAWLFR